MRLFITIEAQNAIENGLSDILRETINKLNFVTSGNLGLENIDNYGTEFRLICIIPSCMDDKFWSVLGWKERKQIWRKKRETDIRLRMNYIRFIEETPQNKRLMFYDIIIKSIQVIQERSKEDFKGEKLIRDILSALNISMEDINQLNLSNTNNKGDGSLSVRLKITKPRV